MTYYEYKRYYTITIYGRYIIQYNITLVIREGEKEGEMVYEIYIKIILIL